jgi:prepilin-type N-terminal cleavage/methylation domain-containing protein
MTLGEALGFKGGFSLIELIVVVAIIAIFASLSLPAISRYVPDQRVKHEAENARAFFHKARELAANGQKPVRVSVNCRRLKVDGCYLTLQRALFTGAAVSDWTQSNVKSVNLHPKVFLAPSKAEFASDGSGTTLSVYWAVFMPDGKVFSSPKPFDLFLSYGSAIEKKTKGYKLIVSDIGGRVSVLRGEKGKS